MQLSLDEAVRIALSRNPSLSTSRVELSSSRLSFLQSLTRYLPQPNVQVSYSKTRAFIPIGGIGLPPVYSFTSRGYSLYFSVDQSIFDPDRFLLVWQAKNQERSSRYQLVENVRNTVLEVKVAYFNALKARRLIQVRKKALQRAKENLDLVETRYRIGSASRLDYLSAKVEAGQAELDLDEAEKERESAERILLNLLGVEDDVSLELEDIPGPEPISSPPPYDSLLKIALETRPLLKASLTSLSTSRQNFWSRSLSFLPKVRFGWYTSYSSEDRFPGSLSEYWNNSERTSGIYISASISLANYPFSIMSARLGVKQEEIALRQRRLQVIREVEESYFEYTTALKALSQARLLNEQAREALEFAKVQYRLGSISSLQLFDSESRYLQAELSWVSSIYDYHTARERLNSAVGMEVIR